LRGRLRALLLRLHVLPALNELLDDRVLDGARIRAGDKVANVGAGDVSLTLGAVRRAGPDGEVFVIDTSVDALEELRANTTAPNVSYFVGRVDVLPLMDESVDAVLTRSTLSVVHVEIEAARELFRVLGSGGRVSMHGDPVGDLEQLFKDAGFGDVGMDPAGPAVYLTAVKP
jgi:ubiquinone/menaquinone biosynthesis C-methylase UbiE